MTRREQKQEAYEDALFALLMEDVIEEEGKRLLEENERLKRDPSAAVPKEVDERCLKTIRRNSGSRSKERTRNVGRVAYRVFTKAAVVVVICMLLFTAAFAASPALRVRTLNLLIDVSGVKTVLAIAGDEKPKDDPDAVAAEKEAYTQFGYQIPELPQDFALTNGSAGNYSIVLTYVDTEENTIKVKFTRSANGEYSIDTETTVKVVDVVINGFEGMLIEKDNALHIVWGDVEKRVFISIIGTGVREDMLLAFANALAAQRNS